MEVISNPSSPFPAILQVPSRELPPRGLLGTAHLVQKPRRIPVALLLATVATASAAFDSTRPAVRTAYRGVASDDKVAAALEGVRELLAVRDLLPPPGGGGAGVIVDGGIPVSAPEPPTITIVETIVAGSDADLAAFGDPLMLDRTLLDITAGFSSARDIAIAAGGAVIDTRTFTLELDGVVSADGLLIKQGSGSLRLHGANVWNVAPFVREGTLVGTPASLATDYARIPRRQAHPVADRRVRSDFDGAYEHAINPGPIFSALQPEVNLVKSGNGGVTMRAFSRLVRAAPLRAGTLIRRASPHQSGALTVAGATSTRRAARARPCKSRARGRRRVSSGREGHDRAPRHQHLRRRRQWQPVFRFRQSERAGQLRLTTTAAQAVSGITQVRHGTLALSGAEFSIPKPSSTSTSSAVFDISAAADAAGAGVSRGRAGSGSARTPCWSAATVNPVPS